MPRLCRRRRFRSARCAACRRDDEIEDRAFFVMLLDFVLDFLDQPAHRLADLAARPHAQLFHRLFDALDLHLRPLDLHLDALAQRCGARLAQGFQREMAVNSQEIGTT